MRIVVVSSYNRLRNEAEIYNALFDAGLQTLHLRKPRFSTRKIKNLIETVQEKYHNRIVIHSHFQLAMEYNIKGLHLTKDQKEKNIINWIKLKYIHYKKPSLHYSTSHTGLSRILKMHRPYEYVFLRPIFDIRTSEFKDYYTKEKLIEAVKESPYPLLACGGVKVSNIELIKEIGFAGLVIHSSIWKKEDPVGEFQKFLYDFKALNINVE